MKLRLDRLLMVALWLPVSLCEPAESRAALQSPADVLAEVPSCAATCLVSAVENSTCSPTDAQCICTNDAINAEASRCIQASCALRDALISKNITSTACDAPVRDKSVQYSDMSIALGSITVFFVLVRVIFKRFFSISQKLGSDDKVILGTLALRISCTIINVRGMAAHGLGKDVWKIPPDELTTFAEFLYIMEVLYLAELSLIKLSLALFYLNIFPGETIRRLLWGTVLLNICFGITFVTTAIFQCTPITFFWTQYLEPAAGHCININAMGWSNAAISVAIDIWMIAIPLSQVGMLNLHWKKKIGVAIMFSTGTFVTIVSVLRLRSLIYFANSDNPTWDQWNLVYWSTIEVNVGMICTCLPSLRLILLRLFPRLFGTSTLRSKSYEHGTEGQTNNSRRMSVKDHALADLEARKGHPWTRIDTESESISDSRVP